MAVLDVLPGIEVGVYIDGRQVKEYNDSEDNGPENDPVARYQASRTVTKYIKSRTGKEFTIKMSKQLPYVQDCPSLTFEVHIDGRWVRGHNVLPKHTEWETQGPESKTNGISVVRPFKFAKIEISADDEDARHTKIKEDSKRMSQVGEIVVKVFRCGNAVPIAASSTSTTASIFDSNTSTKVHEKALKGEAKSHGTAFGQARKSADTATVHAARLDGADRPIAIFKFKYRSKEALRSLLIIERSPEPEQPGALSGLTATQRAEVEEFARLLKNKKAAPAARIKREREEQSTIGGPSKRARTSGTKITIDLTNSDDESGGDDDDEIIPLN